MHPPALVYDLALILATSGVVSILCRRLKQPIVLGYLLAGILIGPNVKFLPTVVDSESVKIWAELGVIFLLFLLGLEFSFRKLFEVGRPALVAAAFEVIFMTGLGYVTGLLLGWDSMDSVFLGGILAISSTTIIIKAFDEQGVKTQLFASLVFGILVIEDLFAVLLLAILSTIAATRTLEGVALLKQVGLLAAFLVVVIPIGMYLIPRLFRWIRAHLNDETRIIVALALCLGLVAASTHAGFSPALGAFLMGALMGETGEGERMERLLRPIRDLFGAIFFTSVGMLVDMKSIFMNFPLVILISLVTVFGKTLSTALGARAGRQDWKTALQAGISMGQIGEFSFIIATLGLTLGVIRPDLYPLAVSVSVITTFSTPYLIRFATNAKFFTNREAEERSSANASRRLWDGHLVEFEVHPHFLHSGTSLQELRLRERFGVSLVALIRGDRKVLAPGRDDVLMPFDRVVVMGTDLQLAKVEDFLKTERYSLGTSDEGRYGLENVAIETGQAIIGKSLRDSGIRELVRGIVLGIERAGERILNPDSTLRIQAGDVLWIYGDRPRIRHWHRTNDEQS